jgi:Subtilase family
MRGRQSRMVRVIFLCAGVGGMFISAPDEARSAQHDSSRRQTTDRIHLLAADDTKGGVIAQWSHSAMRVPEAWAQGINGSGVTVAVIDEGLVDNEGEFAGRIRATKDFVGGPGDTDHGVNAAGIIAASGSDGRGITGVAPGADLLIARVISDNGSGGNDRAITEAVKWSVVNGADVISMSLGVGLDGGPMAALDWAVAQGVVVVMSAGNAACREAYTYWNGQEIPNANCRRASNIFRLANALDSVITVAAVEESGDRAGYSSYGPEVDIAAPTDVMTTGVWRYEKFTGTSAAAPNVAGVAALVLQARPGLMPAQVQAVIQASARAHDSRFEQPTWATCDTSSMIPTCSGLSNDALPQRWLGGAGSIDAAAAVDLARSVTFDIPASISAGTLSFDTTWAAANAGATVGVDGRAVGMLTPDTNLTIDNFDSATQYAVSVVMGTTERLALVQPTRSSIPAPVVQSTARGSGGEVNVVVAAAVNDLLWLYDASGDLVAGCQEYYDEPYFRCSNVELQVGQQYVARIANSRGQKSPPSLPFSISGLDHLTLSAPEITFDVEAGHFVLRISRVAGAGFYSFYKTGWARVSDTGSLVSGASDIECVGSAMTVTCSWPATDGESRWTSVSADLDQNAALANSRSSDRIQAVAELGSIPVARSVRAITISCSNAGAVGQCRGSSATNWAGSLEVEADVSAEAGQSLTGYRIKSSVGDDGPNIKIQGDGLTFGADYDRIGVSVIGFHTRQGFTSYGAEYRTTLSLPTVLVAPSVTCSRGASEVRCEGMAVGGRLEVRFVSPSGAITPAGAHTSSSFSVVPTGDIQVRARPTVTHWARSEWVAAVVTDEPEVTTEPTEPTDPNAAAPTNSTSSTVVESTPAPQASSPAMVIAPASIAPTTTESLAIGSLRTVLRGSMATLRLSCRQSIKSAQITVRDNGRVVVRAKNGRTTWRIMSLRRGKHRFAITAVVGGQTICSAVSIPITVR